METPEMGAMINSGQLIANSRLIPTPHKGAHIKVMAKDTAALTQSTESNSGVVKTKMSARRVSGLTSDKTLGISAHHQVAIGQGGDKKLIVGNRSHGDTVIDKLADHPHQFRKGLRVLAKGGLVQQHHAGCGHQGSRNRQPALIPTRYGKGVRFYQRGQPQAVQELVDALFNLLLSHHCGSTFLILNSPAAILFEKLSLGKRSHDAGAHAHFFQHAARDELMLGILKDETNPDRKSTRLNSSHVSISYAV